MKTGRFKNFTKVCAKFLEVMFFTGSVVMIVATVYSFARGQELVEFLTGLYRLSLKATTELEEKSAMNPETYFQMITEKYRPFDVE